MAEDHVNGAAWDDIEELREMLAGRAAACLQRLDDVVSELVELHSFDPELIIARVRTVGEDALEADEASA